jgi:hypothetical protein
VLAFQSLPNRRRQEQVEKTNKGCSSGKLGKDWQETHQPKKLLQGGICKEMIFCLFNQVFVNLNKRG